MPFPRPTLTALRAQAMQDIAASGLPNADGFLRRSVLHILAWVQAGLAHLHYGYLDWIAAQATPFTATAEFLEAWAALAPTPVLREAPVAATCPTVTFTAAAGASIPSGTLMYRSDSTQYVTTATAAVVGSVITVPIQAVVAGTAGNAPAGIQLTLASVIAGVNSSSGVAGAAIANGTDLELDAALKTRMLESYANPPSGGAAADYVTWALELAQVTRAWTLRNGAGSGTVVVYFMEDLTRAAFNGFPQGTTGTATAEPRDVSATGDQLVVANYLYPLQPVTALVYAAAPAAQPTNFTLTGLTGASTSQKASISAAITAQLLAQGNPLQAISIQQSDIEAAISAIPGLPSYAITVPSSWPLTPALGSLLTLGTLTYA